MKRIPLAGSDDSICWTKTSVSGVRVIYHPVISPRDTMEFGTAKLLRLGVLPHLIGGEGVALAHGKGDGTGHRTGL